MRVGRFFGVGLFPVHPGRRLLLTTAVVSLVVGWLFVGAGVASAQTLTTLYSFKGGSDGANPYFGDLLLDGQGNLYGTTFGGGESGHGVIFKVTPTGAEKVLYTFTGGDDGCSPYTGVIADTSGNLYGATSSCGTYGFGTVYELSKGQLKVLHTFSGPPDGGQPFGPLLRDAAGNLYGTTNEGGLPGCSNGCGTVFEISAAGVESVLHAFTAGSDGENPVGGLIADPKGNMYGTAGGAGLEGPCCGTIYEITPSGTLTVLFAFNYSNGSGPGPNRLVTYGGHIFGTTSAGGASGSGTVFELAKAGTEVVLYNFDGASDGASPYGGVIRDAKGNLYGATFGGAGTGCNDVGCGTIYEVTTGDVFEVLHTFTGPDGGNPAGGLVMDKSGNLYGTTYGWGANGYGTVFKLAP